MRLLGLRRADAHQRAQRGLAQLPRSCPTPASAAAAPARRSAAARDRRGSTPARRASRAPADDRRRTDRCPAGCAPSIGTTRGVLEADQRGDHRGARLAGRRLQHGVQRARRRRVVDASPATPPRPASRADRCRRSSACSGGTAAGRADLPEQPAPARAARTTAGRRRAPRARGIAGGPSLTMQRRRARRVAGRRLRADTPTPAPAPSTGPMARTSRLERRELLGRLIAERRGGLGERRRVADAVDAPGGRRRGAIGRLARPPPASSSTTGTPSPNAPASSSSSTNAAHVARRLGHALRARSRCAADRSAAGPTAGARSRARACRASRPFPAAGRARPGRRRAPPAWSIDSR